MNTCFSIFFAFHMIATYSANLSLFEKAINLSRINSFEQVTTIGANCLSKFRIRNFLRKHNYNEKIENPNHLFDWMVPFDYTLFSKALLNEFNDSFGTDSLKVICYEMYY